jgi:uncharacterized protein (TIGR02246 family)
MRALPVVTAMMVTVAVACQQPGTAEEGAGAPDDAAASTDLRAAHDQLRDEWVAAANRDDVAAVAGMYAEDAVFILPDGRALSGRAAIQEALPDYFAMASGLVVTEQTFAQSGDVIYVTGEFNETLTMPDKKTASNRGRYLVVTQKTPDGRLQIVRHAGVPVQPQGQ